MKQFFKVLNFSFMSQLRNKGFIISTIIMVVIIAAGISVPSIINLFKSDDKDNNQGGEDIVDVIPSANPGQDIDETPVDENLPKIVIVDPNNQLFSDISELEAIIPGYLWVYENTSQEDLIDRVDKNQIFGALVVDDEMTAMYIYKTDINMFGANISSQIRQYMADKHRYQLLMEYNLSETDAAKFFTDPVLNEHNTGLKNMVGQVQSMVFIMFLYIAILSSGQMVAMSVVQEKSSRAMEILITTTRPETLMFGKVIGIGLAGLAQMITFTLTGVAFYILNQNALVSVEILEQFFKIPLSTIIYVFIFYIGGFFFYAMLFGAIGSLISRMEDMGSAQTPLMIFTIAGFLVSIYGQLYGFADSVFYTICSYIPFTSPYVMLARVCSDSNISLWHVLLSIVILYVSTAFVGVLSAKIYRIGVLMYGKPPSIKEVFSAIKQS